MLLDRCADCALQYLRNMVFGQLRLTSSDRGDRATLCCAVAPWAQRHRDILASLLQADALEKRVGHSSLSILSAQIEVVAFACYQG